MSDRKGNESQKKKHTSDDMPSAEKHLNQLMENTSDFIMIADAEGFPVLFNKAYADVMKEALDLEMKAGIKPHQLLTDEETVKYWDGLHERVLSGETFTIEYSQPFADNTVRHYSVAFHPIKEDGKITGFSEVTRDITKYKETEASLKINEERYRSIVNASVLGMHFYTLNKDGELIFTGANPAADKILGVDHAPFVGKEMLEIFAPLAETEVPERYKDIAQNGTTWSTEQINYSDGVIQGAFDVFAFQTQQGSMTAMFSEITKRKKIEEALRKSEKQLREAQRIGCLGSWEWDIVNNTTTWSDELYSIFGVTPEKFDPNAYEAFLECIHSEDRSTVAETMDRAMKTGSPFSVDYRIVRPDGALRNIHALGEIERNTEGRALKMIGTSLDITERKEIEDRLRQSEKMEAIGQLAGGVAHDFNNQLAAIVGYADMLRSDLSDNRELALYADNILIGSKRAADLTAQLLAFARKGKYLSVPVDIHRTIMEVVTLLQHSIHKNIRIKQHLKANPPQTTGDPTQIQNIFLNLALNARDSMPSGGELIFSTDVVDLDEEYCEKNPYEIDPGKFVQICVTDSGAGMDTETQKRIFEPFFTTKELGKGTGMGLAAVYGSVKSHKGAVSVYSEIGRGTTIKIYLPIDTSALEAHDDNDFEITSAGGTTTILLVDDEVMVCEVASKMLQKLGYIVKVCLSGSEAVETYHESWEEIDLVILDMVMPEMDGELTFLAMKEINPDIKVLLASGYSINGDAQRILKKGVIDFIQKPFRAASLSQKISVILNGE